MRRFFLAFLILAASSSLLHGAVILTGTVYVGGESDPMSRGFGRATSVDLSASDGSFAINGGCGDSSYTSPGSTDGSTATPAPIASFFDATYCTGAVGLSLNAGPFFPAQSSDDLRFQAEPVLLPILPEPEPQTYTSFTLPSTPFTAEGHLTFIHADTKQVVLDTDVIGSGNAFMRGVYWRPTEEVGSSVYLIYASEFVFDTPVPEPSTWLLAGAAGVSLLVLKKRTG